MNKNISLAQAIKAVRKETERLANAVVAEQDPEKRLELEKELRRLTTSVGLEFNADGTVKASESSVDDESEETLTSTVSDEVETKPSLFTRLRAWFATKFEAAKARPVLTSVVAAGVVTAGVVAWYLSRGKVVVTATSNFVKKSMSAGVEVTADTATPGIVSTVAEKVSNAASATGDFCARMFTATKGFFAKAKDAVVGFFRSAPTVNVDVHATA